MTKSSPKLSTSSAARSFRSISSGPWASAAAVLIALLLCPALGCAETALNTDHLPGLSYRFYQMDEPRPIRAHVLTVDLALGTAEPVVVLAEDPPEEDRNAVRTDPRRLAGHPLLMAFVNTNPWTPWGPAYPTNVTIIGLAATGGEVRSSHRGVSVWTDGTGRVHIGDPGDSEIREGAGGFQQIVKNTEVIVNQGGAVHPRTAIGVNQAGNRLYLVVVDGRQSGFSEGMSLGELAEFARQELGCWDVANMDGGGSSVMGIVDEDGQIQIINSPPGPAGYLRPLPTLLTIRRKPTPDSEAAEPAAARP